jgi:hypothetical protein
LLDTGEELSPKESSKNADREEEVLPSCDPAVTVGRDPASRDDGVDVGVKL